MAIFIQKPWYAKNSYIEPDTWEKIQTTSSVSYQWSIESSSCWADGSNLYCSEGSSFQYEFIKSTRTWIDKSWSISYLDALSGSNVWKDGENIYISMGGGQQYILNKIYNSWMSKDWIFPFNGLSGNDVWEDNGTIYCSSSIGGSTGKGFNGELIKGSSASWASRTWKGMTSFDGSCIWTDGQDIYYSKDSVQMILNKETSTWQAISFLGGFNPKYGYYIWTDGNKAYYSYGATQKVLDKQSLTWLNKTWKGLTSFYGYGVVEYEGNLCYFPSTTHYYTLLRG